MTIEGKPIDPYNLVIVFKGILEDIRRGLNERELELLIKPDGRYEIGDLYR